MLELKNIKKDYPAGDGVVHALKGISLKFRDSEFVSILGPSGCGKTTLLNILGGLDRYTEGDLIINGRSTKEYKDRDWDTYRNHSIGFVFQSYNLIPHQTVLQNVELSLTLSGVKKAERRRRAKEALEKVGLGDQLKKRPSQLSGGQMQRVAIARALVNNPDIVLADEPTGALDTETSIQVMDILKEVSKNRLVIMVTHNPTLADQYSTRVISMLDGEITDDSQPVSEEEEARLKRENAEKKEEATKSLSKKKRRQRRPSMKFHTAFGLSLRNLFTKKGRTILTSFAGSIGIIGIALVYSVSTGFNAYLDEIQEQTLSAYPIEIQSTSVDLTSIMNTYMRSTGNGGTLKEEEENTHTDDRVYVQSSMYQMLDAVNNVGTTTNDLKSLKTYVEEKADISTADGGIKEALNGIQYTYDIPMNVYVENTDGKIVKSETRDMLESTVRRMMGVEADSATQEEITNTDSAFGQGAQTIIDVMSQSSGSSIGASSMWQELLPQQGDPSSVSTLIQDQYDLVYGSWPDAYDEVVVVLSENNELNDLVLYAMGLESDERIDAIVDAAVNGTSLEESSESWTYEEICSRPFHLILAGDSYRYNEAEGVYESRLDTDEGLEVLYNDGLPLKVTGIIRPSSDASAHMLTGSVGYTSALTEYVLDHAEESEAYKAQTEDPDKDIFTGQLFKGDSSMSDEEKADFFEAAISEMDETEKAQAYVSIMSQPDEAQLEAAVSQAVEGVTLEEMKAALSQVYSQQLGMDEEEVASYFEERTDEEIQKGYEDVVRQQISSQMQQAAMEQMSGMNPADLASSLEAAMQTFTTEQMAGYYDTVLAFSDSTYEDNLTELGWADLDNPSSINLYASSFDNKDVLEDMIADYNSGVDEIHQITYTDYVGVMMDSVKTIVRTITTVLIGFVAISLIVSSIMIGVITLISVQERTKEIGILRAIGASKGNVSSMFNAETLIIGFTSGVLGVLLTVLLCLPVNLLIHHFTGITKLNAYLPLPAAIVLVLISMALTLIAGIIPSRSAARKDPVEALRTE